MTLLYVTKWLLLTFMQRLFITFMAYVSRRNLTFFIHLMSSWFEKHVSGKA
jgi:hypothetical protein